MKNSHKLYTLAAFALFFIFYCLIMTQKINFVIADLGRHIKNGEIFVKTHTVIKTNYYSFTQADFPVVTHHWGSGVIFYEVYKYFGFDGLSVFYAIVSLAAFLIFFQIAREKGGTLLSVFVSFIFLPLLADRTEIRPEVFSYFLAGVFFYLLLLYRENKLREKYLLFLPLFIILWVNLHIYFFIGILLIGVFFLDALLSLKFKISKKAIFLLIIFAVSNIATFINPFGLEGAVAPYLIFKNYGYRVLENQSVWFLIKTLPYPNYGIFVVLFFLLAASFIFLFLRARDKLSTVNLILAMILSAMAWKAVRNFTLFALFAVPLFTENLVCILPKISLQKFISRVAPIVTGLIFFIFLLFVTGNLDTVFPKRKLIGTGLLEGINESAEFFKKEKIGSPIFNNYDIGGYLIFHLFPKERVFVDNRPEAYSIPFFQKTYIPMQEDENVWQKMDEQYKFNAIFFSLNDLTPWGQKFLLSRINDSRIWAPVFADSYALIFVKRNSQNADIIRSYEIPKENFRITERK